jgi:uncharacterized membrane protein YagU involved in acid resistance
MVLTVASQRHTVKPPYVNNTGSVSLVRMDAWTALFVDCENVRGSLNVHFSFSFILTV